MTKLCQARRCEWEVEGPQVMCDMHWSYVPIELQDELAEAYTAGQYRRPRLKSKKWHQLIVRARKLVSDTEKMLAEDE